MPITGLVKAQQLNTTQYIGKTLEDVTLSLAQRSIPIDWASTNDQYHILAYAIHLKNHPTDSFQVRIKCFFKRQVCFGMTLYFPENLNESEALGLIDPVQEEIPYTIEAEMLNDQVIVYCSKSKNELLKKLNSTPLLIEPIDIILAKSKKVNRYYWGSFQVGFPYYETLFNNFGLSFSYSSDKTPIIYTLQYKKTKYDNTYNIYDIDEISYMTAYLLSKGKLRMTFATGLSYALMNETLWDDPSLDQTITHKIWCIPVESHYYFRMKQGFGFGVSLRASINGVNTFYQFGIYLLFGKIR
jgi:hypothetical protein